MSIKQWLTSFKADLRTSVTKHCYKCWTVGAVIYVLRILMLNFRLDCLTTDVSVIWKAIQCVLDGEIFLENLQIFADS